MRRLVFAAVVLLAACGSNDNSNNTMNVDETLEAASENVPESAKVDCDVIHERVTQDECDDIRALSEDVRQGAAALDVPNPMKRGRKSQVTLIVDRRPLREIHEAEGTAENAVETIDMNMVAADGHDAAEADGNAVEADGNAMSASDDDGGQASETPNQVVSQLPGRDYSFGSKVGRYMRASLSGQGFDIHLISPDDPVQEIAAGGQATWIWEVIPKEEGTRSLTAKTEAVAILNGKSKPLGGGQTSKTITVEVRPIDRVWDFLTALPDWLKLIAGVIGGITLVVVAWMKLRKAARGEAK